MNAIVLFDGYCHFCSGSVRFILKRDKKKYFRFASLQSEIGEMLLEKHGQNSGLDSFVLIDGDRCYIKSSAALRVCKHLKGLWKLLYVLWIIPRPVRDGVYDFIAKHRYKWFGKREHCFLPTQEIRDRFLN